MPTKLINKSSGEAFTHYIGRPSIFGNPYVIGKHGSRDEVIDKHREEFLVRVVMDDLFRREIMKLKNGVLSCFCAPDNRCHGETYVEYLDFAPKFRVAGIGSREISHDEEQLLFRLGEYIAKRNWTLSSGNALGSDEWFGRGVNSVNPRNLVLYLPWATYNEELLHSDNWVTSEVKPEWLEEAKKHHGRWEALKQGGQKMMGRNIGIGSRANVCLAVLNHNRVGYGGTGNCFRYCQSRGIPALDISNQGEQSFEQICTFLNNEYEKFRAK